MTPWPHSTLEPLPGVQRAAGRVSLYTVEHGRGRPLVFLHGLGWTHALWRRQLDRYSDRYRAIAADSRGHGQSDRVGAGYTIRDMADDWLALLDTLELSEWALVGFSQGGMIAQHIASLEPARTAALVLVGTSCRTNPATRQAMEERLAAGQRNLRASAELAAASVFSPAFAGREPDFIARFVARRAESDFAALAAATRALYDFDVRSEIAALRCPTLVVAATEDRLVPASASAEIAAVIPGARLAHIAGAGHLSIIEQPQTLERLLDGFLASHYPNTETSS